MSASATLAGSCSTRAAGPRRNSCAPRRAGDSGGRRVCLGLPAGPPGHRLHPFAGQNEREWILRIQATEPDLFGLPTDLEELIRWTLARDPRDRPSTLQLATI